MQILTSFGPWVQAVCKERSAAVACLEALQACDDKARCSLHVGMSQVTSGAVPWSVTSN